LRDAGLRKRRATAEDVAIGEKLRALRLDHNLSQSELGREAGVTFQQLQKYESGANRISAGRLARVALALDVPVTAFYDAAKRGKIDRSFAYLRTKGSVRLVRAYTKIPARGSRAALVTLAEALARSNEHALRRLLSCLHLEQLSSVSFCSYVQERVACGFEGSISTSRMASARANGSGSSTRQRLGMAT
jgi:transcriptional regulator with XRE-family HTH domain